MPRVKGWAPGSPSRSSSPGVTSSAVYSGSIRNPGSDSRVVRLACHYPELPGTGCEPVGQEWSTRLPLVNGPMASAREAAQSLAARSGSSEHDVAIVLGSGWVPAVDALGPATTDIATTELPGFRPPA